MARHWLAKLRQKKPSGAVLFVKQVKNRKLSLMPWVRSTEDSRKTVGSDWQIEKPKD